MIRSLEQGLTTDIGPCPCAEPPLPREPPLRESRPLPRHRQPRRHNNQAGSAPPDSLLRVLGLSYQAVVVLRRLYFFTK